MASFNDLVYEMLLQILLNVPSMQVLGTLIRASSNAYRVFRSNRQHIGPIVIACEIDDSFVRDAQFAFKSSRFKFRGLSRRQALAWLAKYDSHRTSRGTLLGSPLTPHLWSLWEMHRDVNSLAELFVSDRLRTLIVGIGGLNGTDNFGSGYYGLDDLSNTERVRICRAIYRYAIFGNLFYFDGGRARRLQEELTNAETQSHRFLSLFPAWEVEELSCINDFIRDKIVEKWGEAENSLYERLKDQALSWPADRWQENRDMKDIGDFFSNLIKPVHHEVWQRYLATLTLSELREIFNTDARHFPHVVARHTYHCPHDFLTEALAEIPYHRANTTSVYEEHEQLLESGAKVAFQKDTPSKPNEGWLWSRDYINWELYTLPTGDFEPGEGLRRFGYVFWDSQRLKRAGILDRHRTEVARTTLLRYARPSNNEVSVEDRLRQHQYAQNIESHLPESIKCSRLPVNASGNAASMWRVTYQILPPLKAQKS